METNVQQQSGKAKGKKFATLRVGWDEKRRLQKVVRKKADLEDRYVTERELTSVAVAKYCEKEEKKLGI